MDKLKTAWVYFKNYSWFILIIIVSIALILLTMGGKKEFIDDLFKKQKKTFDKELEAIKKSQQEKERLQLENEKKYEDALKEIKDKYELEESELKAKDQKKVKEFIDKYNYSPSQAVKAIAIERGWEYVE